MRAFLDAFLGWRDGGDTWATRGRSHQRRPSDWQQQRRSFAGLVLAFFAVVEPQERQSEHLHMLVWVDELVIGDLQVYMQDAGRGQRCANQSEHSTWVPVGSGRGRSEALDERSIAS